MSELLSIGAAAAALGISGRALRYYQQLGLVTPCATTPGGLRRYSGDDLARVARIRELQSLLGLNLDEIAVVLRSDDRMAEIRRMYHDERTGSDERARLARECLSLQEQLRATVEAKRQALGQFLADVDERIARAREVCSASGAPVGAAVGALVGDATEPDAPAGRPARAGLARAAARSAAR